MPHKYHYIIFTMVVITTAFIGAYTLANADQLKDTDSDGLTDYEEKAIYQTFWNDPDTDKDGYNDGLEVASDYSPKQKGQTMLEADTDNDGLNDAWEIKLGTNLMIRDTDQDGYLDGTEVYDGYSPTQAKREKVSKRIEVNIHDFTLSYYQGDVLLEKIPVSTGKPSTPTPKGTFKISAKVPSKYYTGYPNTKWNMQFATGKNGLRYYIHGAYWHDLFGKKNVSGGCVNVAYKNMERLYDWANEGTEVIIK